MGGPGRQGLTCPGVLRAGSGRMPGVQGRVCVVWGAGLTLQRTLVLPERSLCGVPAEKLLQGEQGA